nr:PHP domain-containing protein [uncultured Sellimonas sp.]
MRREYLEEARIVSFTIPGFSDGGNWYKGNLHSHTVNSDGHLTPEEAVKLYREHGYHFLCFSEHDLYTDYRKEFDCEDFIILPGLEASAVFYESEGAKRSRKVHHIHGILGTEEMQKQAEKALYKHMERHPVDRYYGHWDGAKAAQKLADEMTSRGMIATYNHPVWSRVGEEEFIHTKGIWALEIYNYGTVNESATGYDEARWDVMLREGKRILAFASDDNHNNGIVEDSCGGYIVVKAEELSHEAIVTNMLAGNYYSSLGPAIYDWGIRDGKAYVVSSPVYRIDFIAGNMINDGTSIVCGSLDETVEQGEYVLKGHETYVRVSCSDRYGRTAWSNPIFLDREEK